jgi:hypothetical protein
MNKAAWIRIPIWFILFISITLNVLLFKDTLFMDEEVRLMKAGFVEDVVGYNYCDTFEEVE